MSHDPSWPPVSPHAALLSSPSGRRKYEESRRAGVLISSPPSAHGGLLERLRAARHNDGRAPEPNVAEADMEEDDEETVRLQLAAIEARLKLKKIQQNKARAATPAVASSPRPFAAQANGLGAASTARATAAVAAAGEEDDDDVQVNVSPVRKSQPRVLPASPSRVLLGIDKGLKAADVSLRRANSSAGISRRTTTVTNTEEATRIRTSRPVSRSSGLTSTRSATSALSSTGNEVKSFSERMAEVREREKKREERRDATCRTRTKGFGVDRQELEGFRAAADLNPELPRSPTRQERQVDYGRSDVLQALEEAKSRKRLTKTQSMYEFTGASAPRSSSPSHGKDPPLTGEASLYEGFSRLHLSTRILPHSFLKRTLPVDQYTVYKIPDLLKAVHSPDYELPDGVCDFVVFGVVASKSSPLDHKQTPSAETTVGSGDWQRKWDDGSRNDRKFMAITLTDLKWTIDLYLFGTALPRYHRLTPGTLIAILNPAIMPPKPGKQDTGAFSLSLHDGDDTVLEIGQARDLGFCKSIKKDGKECGSWLNAAKTEICEWHLNAATVKTSSKRMGVNTGTNGFSGTGRFFERGKAQKDGLRPKSSLGYDAATGSHFYVAKSNNSATYDRSGARVMWSGSNDGPYLAEGEISESRDRKALIKRRLAAQEKEREIALSLAAGVGGSSAGGEYLRRAASMRDVRSTGTDAAPSSSGGVENTRSAAARTARATILGGDGVENGTRKRTAEDVRLSPVKKTRFVTDKGIREAGRESLGALDGIRKNLRRGANDCDNEDDDDDDGLDII